MLKKKKKLPSLPSLIKKLDRAMSEWVRVRDKFTCFTCGAHGDKYNMQAGHYVKRQHMSLRFDARNIACQCIKCNHFMDGNQDAYAVRLVRKFGAGILEEFEAKKHEIKKYTRAELEDLITIYKEALKSFRD